MAHRKAYSDLSDSILAGSEETFAIWCQPCSSDQHLEAVGYCQQCSQYLCVNCIKVHSKLAATSHHIVLDKSAMPKTKLQKQARGNDILTEKCRKHGDKVHEYFCKTHDQMCCSVCVTLDHGSCSDKNLIPDISSGIANSEEHRTLRANLDRLIELITHRQGLLNEDSKLNEKYYAKALDDIKEFRKQINEFLDKIVENTKKKVNKLHQENVSIIKGVSQTCQPLLSEVQAMAAHMDTTSNAGKTNQLFVKVKLFRRRKAVVEKQMSVRNKITRYSLVQDEKIQQITSTLSSIVALPMRKDVPLTMARHMREINMKAKEDTAECGILGMAALGTDRIVVSDFDNEVVKLYDIKLNKLISRLVMPSKPFDIAVLKTNQVAVALASEQKISILTVSEKSILSKSSTTKTPGAVIAGLCYNGSNFIAACMKPNSVKIINMSGRTLKTFSTDEKGVKLFKSPWNIALSRDNDVFYVTDRTANTVTSINMEGQVIWVYRHNKLKSPVGVAVGKDGAVYVCSHDTDTVHQLSPSGDLTQIILGPGQVSGEKPIAIAACDENDILYINNDSMKQKECNYIRMYQLE